MQLRLAVLQSQLRPHHVVGCILVDTLGQVQMNHGTVALSVLVECLQARAC